MKTNLHIKVITSSPGGFWATSTLVAGEKDAILIDSQFTLSDAHRLAAEVLESGKNLTTIYITHFHPDHYFGLPVLKEAFPQAKIVALPAVIEGMKETWEEHVKTWKPAYGDNLTASPVIPEPLQRTALTLEGEVLEITGGVQGDARGNSYIWIPSLKAVVTGDAVFNGVYPWTLETTPDERKDWIRTVDRIAALEPLIVAGGHKTPALKDDPSCLQFMKNYLGYYDEALPSCKTAEEFRTKIKSRFPELSLDVILQLASDAVFSKETKAA
jgi:glyoxylase-like metal-dependent hydrolase (beta-lactamase superfamily II)